MAISGVGLGLATAGGVMVYAALKGVNPLTAVREIATKGPSALSANPQAPNLFPAEAGSPSGIGYVPAGMPVPSGGVLPELVNSAYRFIGDKYSQGKRWQNGFSDCSSFVGKAFRGIGITPPGGSTTWDYLAWRSLSKVDASQMGAGDLLVNTNHMVIAIDGATCIGQENPTSNVRVGAPSDLMFGTGGYVVLRYNKPVAVQGPVYTPPPPLSGGQGHTHGSGQ